MQPGQLAAQRQTAGMRTLGQQPVAGHVGAQQARILVHVAQQHELVVGRGVSAAALAGRAALGIHVVRDAGQVRAHRQPPALLILGMMPVAADTQRVGHFRLQVRIAQVAVAVTQEVVHTCGHGVGGPWIALVQAGRTGLASHAHFVAMTLGRFIAGQRAEVPVTVMPPATDGIEGRRIVRPGGQAVIAPHRTGVGTHLRVPQPDDAAPASIPAALPFGIGAQPVATPVVDVPEVVRRHPTAGPDRRPPVVQLVVQGLQPQAHGVPFVQHPAGLGRGTIGTGTDAHGHAGAVAVAVLTHVHAVADALVPQTHLQLTPGKLAPIAQAGQCGAVLGHVHALVREPLERHVLPAEIGLQQVHATAPGSCHPVVLHPEAAGAHFVPRQHAPLFTASLGRLEVLARTVVACPRVGAFIFQMQPLRGVVRAQAHIHPMAIAAVMGAHVAAQQGLAVRIGKAWRSGLHLDAAANAVAPCADRRDAGIDTDALHLGRVDVGQRRVHVVGTGRHQVHVIHRQAQPLVSQAMDHRQPRHTARSLHVHAGHVLQQARGVRRGGTTARDLARIRHARSGQRHVGGLHLEKTQRTNPHLRQLHGLVHGRITRLPGILCPGRQCQRTQRRGQQRGHPGHGKPVSRIAPASGGFPLVHCHRSIPRLSCHGRDAASFRKGSENAGSLRNVSSVSVFRKATMSARSCADRPRSRTSGLLCGLARPSPARGPLVMLRPPPAMMATASSSVATEPSCM